MTSLLDRYPIEELHEMIDLATPDELAVLYAGLEAELYDWSQLARPEQLPPDGDWFGWLIEAGRGWGKTRTGAEYVKDGNPQSMMRLANARWALVPETFADGRDTMVEGESGLLSVLPPSALRGGSVSTAWNRSLGELYLANGSKARIYASERPGQLRGPQHHGAWGDEPAKWKDAHKGTEAEDTTWSNLLLGLRLGKDPRVILTGTPKRVKLLVGTKDKPGLRRQDGIVVTHGTTYDNLGNLAPTFRSKILGRYEGTRLGRQELMAEQLEDVEGALWASKLIEDHRAETFPDLARLVVAVDPAMTATEDSDDTGIIAIGRSNGTAYLLEDATCHEAPTNAMSKVVNLYHDLSADAVVVEANNGGDYLPALIHSIDPSVNVVKVHATRGKLTRAEPIHGLHEQGRIKFHGSFPELEDQLTTWVPGQDSPDRLDAFVWGVTALFPELEAGEGRKLSYRGAA